MEENQNHDTQPRASRNRLSSGILAAGAAVAMTLAGLGVAAAQTDDATSSTTDDTTAQTQAPAQSTDTPSTDTQDPTKDGRCHHGNETPLTGDTATKVTAAAQAAVPGGEVLRVETDGDGSAYEAHVRKADGTRVTVKLDDSFKVTSVDDEPAHPGHPGRRGDRAPAPAPSTQSS